MVAPTAAALLHVVGVEQLVPVVAVVAKDKDVVGRDGVAGEIRVAHTGNARQSTVLVGSVRGVDALGIVADVLGNLVAPDAVARHGEVRAVVRDGFALNAFEVAVEVDVCGVVELLANLLQTVVGDGHVGDVLDAVGCTRQDALHINLRRRTFLLEPLYGCAHVLGNEGGRVHARRAKVVRTHHEEHLGRMSCQDSLEVFKHNGSFCTVHAAVEDFGVAKSLPPFVHVGDAVAEEHDALRVHLVRLEAVVAVLAEGNALRQSHRRGKAKPQDCQ